MKRAKRNPGLGAAQNAASPNGAVLEKWMTALVNRRRNVRQVRSHPFGHRFRHASGLFVRAAPLGLAGSGAASNPGLRTARCTRRPPPWAGLGMSLRDGPQKRRRKSSFSPAPRRGVLETATVDSSSIRLTRNRNRNQRGLVVAKVFTSPRSTRFFSSRPEGTPLSQPRVECGE